MSDETTTPATSSVHPLVNLVISPEDEAAAKAHLEQPAPAPPAEEGPAPERVTTYLRLLCGHVVGTDAPVATLHHCEVHDATFPVVSAHEAPQG